MTIQEIYNKWLPVKRKLVKESTCSTYVYQFTQKILPIYGDKDPEYVTNDEMQRFMLSLIEEGLSVKTAKDIFISFKMLLYYAMERFGVRYIKYRVQFPTANMEATKDLEVYTEFEQKKIISYLRNMEIFNEEKKVPITYIYQFDKDFCVMLLDEVYITRDNTAFTRDNYLGFLKSFSTFCLNHNYLTQNPTAGISSLGRKGKKKLRNILPPETLAKVSDYLKNHNPYMLLASYILYYCFIRPAEMVGLRLNDISLKKQTIFVSDNISKNRKDGTITLPSKVIHLMLDLHIFNNPGDYYLFSDGFRPGKTKRSEKMFRDWWAHHLRKDLKLSAQYKFYSLKDTGITNMLRHYDVLSVRDQARHSSILMTDIYTPHDIQEANDLIKNYQGDF